MCVLYISAYGHVCVHMYIEVRSQHSVKTMRFLTARYYDMHDSKHDPTIIIIPYSSPYKSTVNLDINTGER